MASVKDYVGRTVDYGIFHGVTPTGERLLTQSLATAEAPGGELVTGIQKGIQRFLMLLLLEQGSMRFEPDKGCRFMVDARRGQWRSGLDVQQSFYFALVDIKRQLRAMESSTDPADEKFSDASITGVGLSAPDQATLRIKYVSAAGDSRVFIAPLPTTLH